MPKQQDSARASRRDFVKGATLATPAGVTSVPAPDAQAGDTMPNQMTADEVRELLKLEPNQTCGFVRVTYISKLSIAPGGLPAPFADGRPAGSALYFLMTPQAPVRLHRIRNEQLYHYYLGDPIEVLMLHDDGTHTFATVGPDVRAGQVVQLRIPGNTFHTAQIRNARQWFLGGSTEWPGVVPAEDVELGNADELAAKHADVTAEIRSFPVPAS